MTKISYGICPHSAIIKVLCSYFRPPFPLFFAELFPTQKNELHSGRAAGFGILLKF